MKLRLLFASLLSALALTALSAQETVPASAAASAARVQLKPGDVAPAFTVLGSKGETIKLADFLGKIVVVDVSATWCGPCQAAMPNLDRVARKYADQGVVLLGVTSSDTREAYDGWIKRNAAKYAFTMTFDPAGKDGWKDSVFNLAYGVTGFPTLFVIGRDGKLVESKTGGGPGDDYRLEYALARAGAKVDLAAIPPEPKADPAAPKAIPMMAKTAAMPAAGASVPMMGMGMGAPAGAVGTFFPTKFGSVTEGQTVTDFTVAGADGKPVKLSDYRGKTLLLHFNTSNGPQPFVAGLAANYKAQDLAVLTVFSATEREAFDAWLAKNPAPGFAVAWDPAGKAWAEGVTNTKFGVGMFPISVVIDSAGKLVGGTIGMGARAETLVKAMLAKSKTVKLTADDAAPVLAALIAADTARAASPAAATKAMPAAAAGPARPALLGAGAVAPDFAMKDVAGKDVRLSDFKGKVVILDFWATWCGPCIASFPHAQKLAAKYKDQDVVLLASGTSDTIEKFKEWIPANQPKYPDLVFTYDPNARGTETFEKRASAVLYGVTGIPTQFVIGRDGKIVAAIVGNGGETDTRAEGALALAGVKVAAETAAKGKAALTAAAEQEIKRAAAAAETAKNPPAPFRESFGKLKAGEAAGDFTAQGPDGQPVKFSDLAKGKTVVLNIWTPGNAAGYLEFQEAWSRKYSAQGVLFVALMSYSSRADYDKFLADNAGKFSFPVLFDPAGRFESAKSPNDMTVEEKKEHTARSREHFGKVIAMNLSGGSMAPVPNNLVLDSGGKMLGFYVGAPAQTAPALGNLLLRAGVKLAPEDTPARIYTAEESKEKPPEAKIEMIKIGAAAPDFPATDASGKSVKLSDYRGKVVILDFWATWCGPCIASMPHTQEVAVTYKDQGVVVLASCTSDTRAKFDDWVKANQAKYPDLIFSHDPQERGPDRASRKLYGVGGIPQQFIIGRDGKVAALCTGYIKGEVLLEAALAQAGIKVAPQILAKAKLDQANRDAMR